MSQSPLDGWTPQPQLQEQPKPDKYGNTEDDFPNCCFPDCGCDGARLCCAKNGPSSAALILNIEHRSRASRGEA